MYVFAKFDEIPSMTLQDLKVTKRNGHTFVRSDNVKTVYPPTKTVWEGDGGGIKTKVQISCNFKPLAILMAVQRALCQTWLETLKTGFVVM